MQTFMNSSLPVIQSNVSRGNATPTLPPFDISDTGAIVLGGRFRRPAARESRIADDGTIVLGGGFRLPAARNARVADSGAIILGGGFRLPAATRGR